MSLGLYLHIPYCFSKCRYCDFYSHPGERGVPDAYVEALLRELSRFAPEAPLQPDTLYFGGGTPSLLRPEQAKRLIDAARPMPGAEITLEANPETVTEESLAGFREAGGIVHYGAYRSQEDADTIKTMEVNGIKFAFLGYMEHTNGNYLSGDGAQVIYLDEEDKIKAQIEEADKMADVVVVSCHYGTVKFPFSV